MNKNETSTIPETKPSTATAMGSRRGFLKTSLATAAAAVGASMLTSQDANAQLACRVTPRQPEGPFYPIHDQLDKDNDLTIVQGSSARAKGQVIYVMGQVTGPDCLPLEGVLVEIWQACESGKYNHANDPNPAPLDPNFQYFGKAITDREGRYVFKTILPGAYPAGEGWIRPPHIHYRVLKTGFVELITQLYFAGDALNDVDLILQSLPKEDRDSVVVPLEPPTLGLHEPDSKVARFDMALRKPRAR